MKHHVIISSNEQDPLVFYISLLPCEKKHYFCLFCDISFLAWHAEVFNEIEFDVRQLLVKCTPDLRENQKSDCPVHKVDSIWSLEPCVLTCLTISAVEIILLQMNFNNFICVIKVYIKYQGTFNIEVLSR